MAWAVESEADLLSALQGDQPVARVGASPAAPQSRLLRAIEAGKHTPAAIALFLGESVNEVMAALMEAEIEGWVSRGAGSHYEVINGH
jgi:predicted Rossmann fold nucleotide-binding protein DprA/Smf involved in DNA uptake